MKRCDECEKEAEYAYKGQYLCRAHAEAKAWPEDGVLRRGQIGLMVLLSDD